jgi:peroxiredoxin
VELNQTVPDFTLPDLTGRIHILSDYRGRIVVINFWSAECPYASQADAALQPLLLLWGKKVALLTVASNENETPAQLRAVARRRKLPLVLRDEAHQVADRFEAVTTPHVFVLDETGRLRYQGAFDDVTFRRREPTRFYLREAVEALLVGRSPDPAETAPYGCSIVRFVLE